MAARTKKPTKRSKRSNLDKAARRQQILEAARDVFAKRGYHQTTIDHVDQEAGVARGTFYLYFEDKRAVLSELIDRFNARIGMAITTIVTEDKTRSVAEQAKENVRAVVTLALNERAMTKILFQDAIGVDPSFDRKLLVFYDEVVQLLTESLHDGQRLGIVADGEPKVLAYMTIGALKELMSQVVTLGLTAASADVLTEQIFAFLSRGVLRVEEPATAKRRKRSR